MTETPYTLTQSNERLTERLIDENNLHYIHLVFPPGEGLAEHRANAHLYMTVLRGTVTLQLDDQPDHEYGPGSLLSIPYRTLMNVNNKGTDVLELINIKIFSPGNA